LRLDPWKLPSAAPYNPKLLREGCLGVQLLDFSFLLSPSGNSFVDTLNYSCQKLQN